MRPTPGVVCGGNSFDVFHGSRAGQVKADTTMVRLKPDTTMVRLKPDITYYVPLSTCESADERIRRDIPRVIALPVVLVAPVHGVVLERRRLRARAVRRVVVRWQRQHRLR